MRQYLIKRTLAMIPTLFVVSVVLFLLVRVMPGDAAMVKAAATEDVSGSPESIEGLRQQLGLDKPYWLQYVEWVWAIVTRFDMGHSFFSNRPVTHEIWERFPITLELAFGTIIVTTFVAIIFGVISAARQDTPLDYLVRITSVLGLSIPNFWLGTLLILIPAFMFSYIPPMGFVSPFEDPGANLQQFILPWVAIGAHNAATTMRMVRSQMLEVLRQDYVRTAWAKGLTEKAVLARHALKNAMIPVMTLIGLNFGTLLGGVVTIEAVFVLPGLGLSTLSAINNRDYAQIQANVLFITVVFLLINLAVDVMYAWADPRIRYR